MHPPNAVRCDAKCAGDDERWARRNDGRRRGRWQDRPRRQPVVRQQPDHCGLPLERRRDRPLPARATSMGDGQADVPAAALRPPAVVLLPVPCWKAALAPNRFLDSRTGRGGQTGASARCFLDLVLFPLVAFDRSGNRLGMGAGFYDKTFEAVLRRTAWPGPKRIGIAYEMQMVDSLPGRRLGRPSRRHRPPSVRSAFRDYNATRAATRVSEECPYHASLADEDRAERVRHRRFRRLPR